MSKKTLLSSLAAAVIIIIIGSITYFKLNPKTHLPSEDETTQEENIKTSDDDLVLLYKEQDDVFYTLPNEPETQLVDEETSIPSGTEVRTSNGIAVVVFLDDSIMTIDENTTVMVNYDDKSVSVLQSIGNTWHRVTSLISSNNSYEVNTPSALATVRGTVFGVMVDENGESDVMVDESLVDVSQHTSRGLQFIGQLQAREGLFVTRGEMTPEMIRKLNDDDLAHDWLQRNRKLDNKWLELKERGVPPRDMLKKFKVNGELRALRRVLGQTGDNPLQREEGQFNPQRDQFDPDNPPFTQATTCDPSCRTGFHCEYDCEIGLACENVQNPYNCIPNEPVQTWCEPSCQEGYFCDTNDFSCKERPPRTCRPACDQGYTCNTSNFTCESNTPPQTNCEPICDQGYTCNTSTFECEQSACIPHCNSGYYCNTSTYKCEVISTGGGGGTYHPPVQTTCEPACTAGYTCNTSNFTCQQTDCNPTCSPGMICNTGTFTCETDLNYCSDPSGPFCDTGYICESNSCISDPNYCDDATGPYCDTGYVCNTSTSTCEQTDCVPACTTEYFCNTSTFECEPETTCSPECNLGYVCDISSVEPICVEDTSCDPECDTGQVCSSGTCVTAS